MPEIWFIRHGESTSNANLRTTHPADSPLTPQGEREAKSIAASFDHRPDLLIVSPYLRARQTAAPTVARFHPIPQEHWPVQEFTFLAPIRYLNTTGTERIPFARDYWQRNDPQYKDGGEGESFAELMDRVQHVLARLRHPPAPFTAVFSHGLFLGALLWSILTGTAEVSPESMERYHYFVRSIHLPNGAIIRASFCNDGAVFLSPFDTSHLSS
ncbi:MAG: histidine phosphatase family protein [Anaerolineae bacterium]